MNRISGRVVLKESGAGLPDLVVAVHDVDVLTSISALRAAALSGDQGALDAVGHRIGGVVTDRQGAFELTYEDDPPPTGTAGRRPGLFLVVQAPDEDSDGPAVLHTSPGVRLRAGRVEQYLIRLTADQLTAAGVPVPAGTTAQELERPESLIHDVGEALKRQIQAREDVRLLAAEQVGQARARSQQVETELQTRLIERLTNVPAELAERFGLVPPDATRRQIEAATWKTVARNVEEVVNQQDPVVGYIQVPDADLPLFQTPEGEFRDDLTPEEVEPYLFGDATAGGRTVERIREDPVALSRRGEGQAPTLEAALEEENDPGGGGSPGEEAPPDEPLTIEDVPIVLGRVVRDLTSPEVGLNGDSAQRPTQDDIQKGTDKFALSGGPADVPSKHDFHNLQIAFDHVWQQAIDEQVLSRSQELAHSLIEAGADPISPLREGADPLRTLRSEVRAVQRAQTPAAVAPLLARQVVGQGGPAPIVPNAFLDQSVGGGVFSTGGGVFSTGGGVFNTGGGGFSTGGGGFSTVGGGVVNTGGVFSTGGGFSTVGGGVVNTGGVFSTSEPSQPHELLADLEALLQEQFKFEIFAPGAINFGINVTYRQRWEPITYQVGNLVKTITLAPKESRKVTIKHTRRKERAVSELENNLRVRKNESRDTARDEAEIVRKAQGKTSFSLTAQGSYDIGIADGDSTTSFTKDASTDSADVKKAFREAVIAATEEFKNERTVKVETKEFAEDEVTESTEISNPNDELTVTYLFYELQRRFRVSEHLHRLTPVVLVGMEVPNPSRKAMDRLLLTHSWIIGRVLLDDRYRPALQYLTTCIVGDELALAELARTVAQMRTTVDRIQQNHTELVKEVKTRNAELQAMMELRAQKVAADRTEGFKDKAWEFVVGSGDAEDVEAARMREENARETYEKTVREEKELRESLQSETAALNAATQAHAKAFAEHANHLLEIASLRVHIKANILYYMQAIWSHTFRDQIFFSLHKLKAPALRPRQKTYAVDLPTETPAHVVPRPGTTLLEVRASLTMEPPVDPAQDFVTLAEVADLDHPLGFKGNYMVFPLKRSNALTDFMMVPYVDAELGLHDPDQLGNWDPEEFVSYVRSLKKSLSEAEFETIRPRLAEQYRRIISAPRRAQEEIVVPTTSLYIEALPGAHPNLEDFKLKHRAIDVQRVAEEVRKLKLESLRYAARILSGEREDPDVERKIVFDGNGQTIVVPAEN
jgi:hypothetical protein